MGDVPGPGVGVSIAAMVLAVAPAASGQFPIVQKVSALEGGLVGPLSSPDAFGSAVANLGDVNGDGVDDLAVGARNRAGQVAPVEAKGGLWLTEMSLLGEVLAEQEISEQVGGFDVTLTSGDRFGWSIADLGAPASGVLCDGFPALRVLAVGAPGDDDGGPDRGALWILFVGLDRQVRCWQKISGAAGGFPGVLADGDAFGRSVTPVLDANGDGVADLLAVGADGDDTAGLDKGAVWLLRITPAGSAISAQRFTQGLPTVPPSFMLDPAASFGRSVTCLDDLDGAGPSDFALAIGAHQNGELNGFRGSVFVFFFTFAGTVTSFSHITDGVGVSLAQQSFFGESVAALEDIDGNGRRDLAVGAPKQGGGLMDFGQGKERTALGRVFVLALHPNGTVAASTTIGSSLPLGPKDFFGTSVTEIGNAPGLLDLAVGARGDDDGGGQLNSNLGANWVLSHYVPVP